MLLPKINLGFTRKSAHQFFHTPSMVLSDDLAYFVYLREEPVDPCEPVETGYQSMQLVVEGPKHQTKDTPNKLELGHHSTLRMHVRQLQPSNRKATVLSLS
jgi:hypothetical protein